MKKRQLKLMVLTAMFIALGYVLPFLTGSVPEIGKMLCPMHIPAFLCGIVCGPLWAVAYGITTPLLRSLTLGAPKLFPSAIAMAVELPVYGVVCALMKKLLPKGIVFDFIGLVISMLAGRLMSGLCSFILLGIEGSGYAFGTFITTHFVMAWPGILLQLLLIPAISYGLEKAKLIPIKD